MTVSDTLDRAIPELRLPPPPPARPLWLRRRRILIGASAVLLLLGTLALKQALDVRNALETGRSRMETARDSLIAGEAEAADRAFLDAGFAFADAGRRLGEFPLSVVRLVPGAGNTTRTLRSISEAGVEVVVAGRSIASRVSGLPGGFSALSPRDGRIDPRPLRRLAPSLDEAARHLRHARELVAASPTSFLPGPVREARTASLAALGSLEGSLDAAGGLVARLRELLGEDGPARYFVAAQNPAELRGTGGLIGAYAILEVSDGRFEFGEATPIQNLPDLPVSEVEAPNPEYARHYDRFGGAGFWRNMNMTPDFPSAAAAIAGAYQRVEGVRLDGVIAADPYALQGMLEVTGPVEVEEVGVMDADSIVDFATHQAYLEFEDQGSRKIALGRIALGVIQAYLEGAEGGLDWLEALTGAAQGGHLLLWSDHPEIQREFERASLAGNLTDRPGDRLAIVQNNGAGNKVDYYLDRRIRYTVRLGAGGRAEGTVEVFLENDAPPFGPPRYVIGPYPGASEAGENVAFLSTYCAARCRLREAVRNGRRIEVYPGTELGWTFYRDYLRIPSRGSASLRLEVALEDVWAEVPGGGTYRLTFLDQPTVRPSQLEVRVVPPPGAAVSSTSPGTRVVGEQVVWEGDPTRVQELEVTFET